MLLSVLTTLLQPQLAEPAILPIGKYISPAGTHGEVGSYPLNMTLSKDGRFALVTTCGYRQSLSAVEVATGRVVSQVPIAKKNGLYFGLAVHPKTGNIFASNGALDKVTRYGISPEGQLTTLDVPVSVKAPAERKLPYHFAGLALNSNGSRLLVVNNQTSSNTKFQGSATLFQTETGRRLFEIPTSGFPLACVMLTRGPLADRRAYVASERDGCLDILDLRAQTRCGTVRVGAAPVGLLLNRKQNLLYCANSGSDTVSVLDTTTERVIRTINLRPAILRGLPGAGPLGLALSDDEQTLYVTLGDMEAIAVVQARTGVLRGYVPTGWLPTSMVQVGGHLLVASAKGTQAANPNSKPVGTKGTYIQDIIAGTVSSFPTPTKQDLRVMTPRVIANNRLRPGIDSAVSRELVNPGIKHVIYIIKENRTYDNVLGDLKRGNGDPSLTLFPRAVTPNQHALAERFALLDNFHVCAEVSQDGWQWSISGMSSAYASRNTPYNYSGRGRSYDTEGQNNGEAIDFLGQKNVALPASETIWHHAAKHGVPFRNYGMYVAFVGDDDKRLSSDPNAKDSFPLMKVLAGKTDTSYRHYDLQYPDSPAYDEFGFTWKKRLLSYGTYGATNRFAEWKREFEGFVQKGAMPALQTVRLPNDHTMGTAAGVPTPQSQVADNDYAVGLLVETVSKSPFWKDTLICVLEDDAQAGIDHVDAHRSIAFVVSPFVRRGTVDSRFYNTDSMLRTMGIMLGMPPMNQYDAIASPIRVFGDTPANSEPFEAIQPAKEVLCNLNSVKAYRAKDSLKIARYFEDGFDEEHLNDILWKAIKGVHVPTPKPIYALIKPKD